MDNTLNEKTASALLRLHSISNDQDPAVYVRRQAAFVGPDTISALRVLGLVESGKSRGDNRVWRLTDLGRSRLEDARDIVGAAQNERLDRRQIEEKIEEQIQTHRRASFVRFIVQEGFLNNRHPPPFASREIVEHWDELRYWLAGEISTHIDARKKTPNDSNKTPTEQAEHPRRSIIGRAGF